MMETFSPIDSVEFLSNSPQIALVKTGSNRPVWGILLATVIILGLIMLIIHFDKGRPSNEEKRR